MKINNRLAHYRQLAGLTQQALADAVGVNRAQIAGWERSTDHRVAPNADQMTAIVLALEKHLPDIDGLHYVLWDSEVTHYAKVKAEYQRLSRPPGCPRCHGRNACFTCEEGKE